MNGYGSFFPFAILAFFVSIPFLIGHTLWLLWQILYLTYQLFI